MASKLVWLLATYRRIDIAFNNAGLMPVSDIASRKIEEWHRMVDVNVKGVFNTVAAVLPIDACRLQ
jgi:NADP-dependent 3-hydroxy acid dehydrogenase YdfG